MRKLLAAACFAALTLPAAAVAADQQNTSEDQLAKLLHGRIAGKPISCIPIAPSNDTTTIDKTAIVYGSGSRLYVNRPRSGAESLDDDQILVTKVHGSQLCNNDVVDLVDRSARMRVGFVILGDFVPYERVK